MKKSVTIQDIADLASVSKTTISRYLNGKREFMSDETWERIDEIIKKTGYRPNRLAGGLKKAKSDMIGLILSNPTANLTPFLVGSISDTCAKHGKNLVVVATHDDAQLECEQVQTLIDQQIDGLIVATGKNFSFYEALDAERIPVILVDRIPPQSSLDWVAINHDGGTRSVVEHLLERGFQRIILAVRANRSQYGTIAIRERSAEECCKHWESPIRFDKLLIQDHDLIEYDYNNQDILDGLQEAYLKRNELPTAIFVADGILLGRFISAFYRLGLTISEDFSLAGYDVWNFGGLMSSPIATIDQPLTQMGTMASERLFERIEKRKEPMPRSQILLDCRITLPE